MDIINKCGKEDCNPVMQTRGEMKPEDHHMQHQRLVAVQAAGLPDETFRKDVNEVDVEDEHKHDVRVSCSKCGRATGWDRRDTEEFKTHGPGDNRRHTVTRDANIPNVVARWNALIAP
jgi:hypothetical protein